MSDLTERYVGATLRTVPDDQKSDIEAELRASIDDAVEARLADGEPADVAETRALTALGDPDRLAAGYAGRPGHLIGPGLFFDYKRLLVVLLLTVVPIVATVVTLVRLLADADWAAAIGGAISTALAVTVHVAFWTTLVFAILERNGHTDTGEWTPDRLPPLVPARGGIKLSDTVASVVFLVIAIVGLILARDYLGATADGVFTHLFAAEMWDFWLPALIGVLIVEVVFEAVKYRVGRWTLTLAFVNLILNLAFAIPAIYLLTSGRMLNPDFFAALPWPEGSNWLDSTVTVTVVVIVAVSLWDVFDGFRKAWMARG